MKGGRIWPHWRITDEFTLFRQVGASRNHLFEIDGLKVFVSTLLSGDNTNGWHVVAGYKSFLTFADKTLEVGMEEDLIGSFGSAYKDLFVYGAKVTDARRKFGAHAFVKFA
jgi:hypothetical protein